MKKAYKIDVAVLLIFFSRPETFEQVFTEVKKARPSKLFLYQDGPREGRPDDIEGINKCRIIAEDIDWDCEVFKFYQEKNRGCDPSEFIAQKWAFSMVDKCIVLEDDDVPSQSFFPFCMELLDKYEHDDRINIISGMNHLGKCEDREASYLFTSLCSISGWASWKRIIDSWDETYSFLEDTGTVNKLRKQVNNEVNNIEHVISTSMAHKKEGKAYYESILASNRLLNNRLNIVPCVNLISNIGVTKGSTHSMDSVEKLPSGIRRLFNMETYEMSFPLKHPNFLVEDYEFQKKVIRIMGWGHPAVLLWRKIEVTLIKIQNGDIAGLKRSVQNLFKQ